MTTSISFPSSNDYGSLSNFSEAEQEQIKSVCVGKTMAEIRQIVDYFEKTISNMRHIAENDLTMEDFDKVKKSDSASDSEDYDEDD